jgi:signal peptidase I
MSDQPPAATATAAPNPRRLGAAVLSFLAPGLGHLAIGHRVRGTAWLLALLGCWMGAIAAALAVKPGLAMTLFAAVLILKLAAPLDTLRLRRPSVLPGAASMVLIVCGFFAYLLLLSVGVQTFVIEAFQTPSGSMYPTLQVGDHFFANKLTRQFRRGDVVVFRYPLSPDTKYIKRVVGVGGDTIELRHNQLLVNGQLAGLERVSEGCQLEGEDCSLWEEQLDGRGHRIATTRASVNYDPVTVPAGSYFVLGDNRDNSNDSRVWGFVPAAMVLGKASFIWWSKGPDGVRRWERFNTPVR